MRSSAVLAAVALAAPGAGCDLVFGVDRDTATCGDESFANATATEITEGEAFSVSWDRDLLVYTNLGTLYEKALPDGTPVAIETDTFPQVALAPEGDAMFITAHVEPPVLRSAVRSDGARWDPNAVVPTGTFAGSPSAAEFGPRRVLVRLRPLQAGVQEYEADGNTWRPVGDVHAVNGAFAPNLTPSGLDLVYADWDNGPAVYIAHRSSIDEWFGAPVAILPGMYKFPQLLGRCRQLYAIDATAAPMVTRYDR